MRFEIGALASLLGVLIFANVASGPEVVDLSAALPDDYGIPPLAVELTGAGEATIHHDDDCEVHVKWTGYEPVIVRIDGVELGGTPPAMSHEAAEEQLSELCQDGPVPAA